jgi:xanthine dehydrogenase accessory factor
LKLLLLRKALAAQTSGAAAALVTDLASGAQAFVEGGRAEGPLALDAALLGEIGRAIAEDRSRTIDAAAGRLFVEVYNPPLRCLVVGAAHIAQPLTRMAALAGYAVTVVDPRSAFATEERFPGVTLSTEWPDEAFAKLRPDHRTAVVTLTHDPKIDDPALIAALRSDSFYIGALGSRRTHAARLARLKEAGFGEAELQRILGPVGLDIGAVSPAEIAVSILAQIIEKRHDAVAGEAEAPGRAA